MTLTEKASRSAVARIGSDNRLQPFFNVQPEDKSQKLNHLIVGARTDTQSLVSSRDRTIIVEWYGKVLGSVARPYRHVVEGTLQS